MSVESFKQFLQQVAQEPDLQQQLQSATDRDSLVKKVMELGKEKGYSFTLGTVFSIF